MFNSNHSLSLSAADVRRLVAEYQRLRSVQRRLNDELVGRLSKDMLYEGGRKLGILQGDVLVFDSEDETSVLMDFCIYQVERNGRNAVEQYLIDSPPDPDSDEMTCLQVMESAAYTFLLLLEVKPGVGCLVRDMGTDETRLLIDMGLSRTGKPNLVLATHLLDFGEYVATAGASLPLTLLEDNELADWERDFYERGMFLLADPATVIRECLRGGASSHVRYEETARLTKSKSANLMPRAENSSRRRRALAARQSRKAAANRRCPCGSGKMYKNCCMKK